MAIAFVEHPLAYFLRVRAVAIFSNDPDLALVFSREPVDRPVLTSGTADTPMIVMDPCVISDADGFHLFFSSFFCDTPNGLSPF